MFPSIQITPKPIYLFHRNDLGVTTTCCSALDTKGGSLGWLSHTGKHILLEMRAHCLDQTDGGGALAFT